MDFKETITALREGKTLLYPSDTIWGIGCDATNDESCQRITALKGRSDDKSFIVLVDSFSMLEYYIPEFPEVCYDLVDLATRPLTIIYPNAQRLAPSVLANDGSVGIRVTKDPNCLKLIRGMRKPLVSTSANLSGSASPNCFDEVQTEIKQGVDLILEERLTEKMTTPSQIIKIGVSGDVKVIR
jgi:L-threonylcarbamoyladenylate synthase